MALFDPAMEPISVLLVDNSPEFLQVAAAFLSMIPQVAVVGTARSGQEGLRLTARLCPDLVLMDLVMPGMNGLEATKMIRAQAVVPKIIMLTLYDIPEYRAAAAAAGADGFLNKADFTEGLLPLMRDVLVQPAHSGGADAGQGDGWGTGANRANESGRLAEGDVRED
jgi:DNA-binding NarL/FixJ family response regulator